MANRKDIIAEIALLYYKKGLTQQEIANRLKLTRQTVSKLLTAAVDENVVEIIVHNPKNERKELEFGLKEAFGIRAVVCNASKNNDELRKLSTTQTAIEYLSQIVKKGNLRIAVSWGRCVQTVIRDFPNLATSGNVVFPMFGATDYEQTYFLSNELAREFAAKLNAKVKFAWFPYLLENADDFSLFRRTQYFGHMQREWDRLDVALMGIGNEKIFQLLQPRLNKNEKTPVGDVATHFFTRSGKVVPTNEWTLRISEEQLRGIKEKIAVAYGDDKVDAIHGAIKAGFVDTLITDEYTAKQLLALHT